MNKEDIKKTLNIPHTDFLMKVNHETSDLKIHEWWIKNQIYEKSLLKNKNNIQKILHDGPPYANGKLHIGHAMNKVLKDMFVRLWNMQGYYSPFVMGWDVHGLPIEHELIKLGINKDPKLSIIQKRENCKEFALKNVELQKEQIKQLGIFTNYDVIYKTSDPFIEFKQLRLFNEMIKDDLIYKALKPVYWSWSSQSALAEDEIEYHDEESDSIFVKFDLVDNNYKDTALLIWTTTPWTIPANLAVAVHPKFNYAWIEVNNNKYIVASDLINSLSKKLGWKDVQVLKNNIKGSELENLKYLHPLYDETHPIILADYVSADDGTGLVHNAPAFGLDDYKACLKYGIGPQYCPIDNYGKFDNTVKSKALVGMFYKDANSLIIEWLKNNNHLLSASKFTHSVAFDWRTKKPVIYRATKQWFVDLNKIREQLVNTVNDDSKDGIKFPNGSWARKNLAYMVGHRSEWTISRQRYWGVPITIIYDEYHEPIFDFELMNHIVDLIEQAGTSNIWFSEPVEYFLTDKYKNNACKYYKETDIMDVWFDSGSSHNIFSHFNWNYPVELYLEGVDQYRGWFNSSTITGVVLHNKAPFKTLISHGFILDNKGNKMSKSLGNVISAEEIQKKYGNDIFRLWVASSNWMDDVRIGEEIMKQVAESYRKIRNTLFRYSLSNLYDFNPNNDLQKELELEDLYILKITQDNLNKIIDWFNEYNLLDITKTINNVTNNLSNWYFDIIKDVLYCDSLNSKRRKQIQTTLYLILRNYLIVLAPILPHIAEELYQIAKTQFNWTAESIFLESYIKHQELSKLYDFNKVNDEVFQIFFKTKDEVYAKLEKLRSNKIINKNNEAIVYLTDSLLTKQIPLNKLKEWLNVANVFVDNELKVEKAENYYCCDRCWNWYHDPLNNNLCKRCNKVVEQLKQN